MRPQLALAVEMGLREAETDLRGLAYQFRELSKHQSTTQAELAELASVAGQLEQVVAFVAGIRARASRRA